MRFATDLLARANRKILNFAAAHSFILVTTDSDFERLLGHLPGAKVVILRASDYPTEVAAEVLRRNAIRIAELASGLEKLILLNR